MGASFLAVPLLYLQLQGCYTKEFAHASTFGNRRRRSPRPARVRRAPDDADARGVVVALTDAGVSRLTETAPVHMRGVANLFVAHLDDEELAVLERALDKVTLDCTFG